jgi:hypothetical protein
MVRSSSESAQSIPPFIPGKESHLSKLFYGPDLINVFTLKRGIG